MFVCPWNDCKAYEILTKGSEENLLGVIKLERNKHSYFEVT